MAAVPESCRLDAGATGSYRYFNNAENKIGATWHRRTLSCVRWLRSDFSAVDIKKYPEISGGFCAEKHLNQRNKACTNTDPHLFNDSSPFIEKNIFILHLYY